MNTAAQLTADLVGRFADSAPCHAGGEAFVEATYRLEGDTLDVSGSSSRNADGNYIAWRERLHRVTPRA
jgi:hypothetical protein